MEINNSIDNVINTEIPQQINNSIIYGTKSIGSTINPTKINIGTPYRYVIIVAYPGADALFLAGIFSTSNSSKSFTGGMIGHSSDYASLNIVSITSTSFSVQYSVYDSGYTHPGASTSYIAFI